jgi:hypothetical protein
LLGPPDGIRQDSRLLSRASADSSHLKAAQRPEIVERRRETSLSAATSGEATLFVHGASSLLAAWTQGLVSQL